MTTLPAFLLARLAEDQEIAEHVARMIEGNNAQPFEPWAMSWHDEYDLLCIEPSRALADVAAKRAIVERHPCDDCGMGDDPCATLRHLVSVYRDHPEFDEGWAL